MTRSDRQTRHAEQIKEHMATLARTPATKWPDQKAYIRTLVYSNVRESDAGIEYRVLGAGKSVV